MVERYNPHARRRVDLFGVIDLVAITPQGILGIQATSGSHHADRVSKILCEARAWAWISAGGLLEVWSWDRRGARGKRKRYEVRIERITREHAWSLGDAWTLERIADSLDKLECVAVSPSTGTITMRPRRGPDVA